jgi:hypothetical protein
VHGCDERQSRRSPALQFLSLPYTYHNMIEDVALYPVEDVRSLCIASNPCKHNVIVRHRDETAKVAEEVWTSRDIYMWLKENSKPIPSHFQMFDGATPSLEVETPQQKGWRKRIMHEQLALFKKFEANASLPYGAGWMRLLSPDKDIDCGEGGNLAQTVRDLHAGGLLLNIYRHPTNDACVYLASSITMCFHTAELKEGQVLRVCQGIDKALQVDFNLISRLDEMLDFVVQ